MGLESNGCSSEYESSGKYSFLVSDEDLQGEIFIDYLRCSISGTKVDSSFKQELRIIYVLQGEYNNSCYGHFFVERDSRKKPHLNFGKVGLKSCDTRIEPSVLEFLASNLSPEVMRVIPNELK